MELRAFLVLAAFLSSIGLAIADNSLDNALKRLGFINLEHYQQNRTYCLDLFQKRVTSQNKGLNCNMDFQCLQREAAQMMERSNTLMQSPEWKNHICDTIMEVEAASRRDSGGGSDCESGHWIESVSDDGEIIKLEDESIWQVDQVDTIDSTLWLPVTDIVVCDGKLINADDSESVSATRIR